MGRRWRSFSSITDLLRNEAKLTGVSSPVSGGKQEPCQLDFACFIGRDGGGRVSSSERSSVLTMTRGGSGKNELRDRPWCNPPRFPASYESHPPEPRRWWIPASE